MYSQVPTREGFIKTAGLRHLPYWLDSPIRPDARPAFSGIARADLVIIGGGFTGLWAALESKIANPSKRVVLLEGDRIACGATGRNGGFVAASLTHGFSNGLSRWPTEIVQLQRLGIENLHAMAARIQEFEIDCDWLLAGELDVAVSDYQWRDLKNLHTLLQEHGNSSTLLDSQETRNRVNSPAYIGSIFDPNVAVVNPAELAWGLARAAEALGVQIFENSHVISLTDADSSVKVETKLGIVQATRALLATSIQTNSDQLLLKRLRHYLVPVYDYILMTEPLTPQQQESVGWRGREGIGDSGNQFHYYRITKDSRILFGGFDAIYHRNNGMGPQFDVDHESFARLADHFVDTFPQLSGVEFTHGWGGAIDTCSRFSAFWGTAHRGKTAYVAGYTGLGVGASRFGALTCLDLLDGRTTERTQLSMVQTKPIPFPPEPFRSIGINVTTKSLQKADQRSGQRNLWLKTLDRLGLGFDS